MSSGITMVRDKNGFMKVWKKLVFVFEAHVGMLLLGVCNTRKISE
jgi:hypothetical protein